MSDARKGAEAQQGGDAYQRLTERVGGAYSAARERVGEATAAIEPNPVALLLGGLAVGAIAGALIPTGTREREALEPIGGRIGDAARAALDAARTAGGDALSEAGLDRDALRGQASNLLDQAVKVAGVAGNAALSAARDATQR
jgi:hypothetical protein